MRTSIRLLCGTLVIGLLSACGGGTDGTGGTTNPPPVASNATVTGVMTKGSVIVNGISFDDSTATIIRIDDRSVTSDKLQSGMFVKVRGRINSDGVSGAAERIEVEAEVRGVVTSVAATNNPPSFTVAGLTIFVDSTTIFPNLSGISALVAGSTRVEVHGLRDAAGNVRASRVAVTGDTTDELKGTVSNLNTTSQTFTLGAVLVNFTGAEITPAGATLSNGAAVEVHGSFNATTRVFTATKVDLEDREDAAFEPAGNDEFEIEGFVTGFTATPGTFTIGTRTVQTTATTRFKGGSAADLANGVKIEAEGTVTSSGVLIAQEIEFKDGSSGSSGSGSGIIELNGVATAVNVSARTVTMFGKTIQVNDLTEVRTALSTIVVGIDRLEIRGSLDAGGNVIVQRLERTNSGDGRDIVQARVTAENETAFTLTLLDSINVALGGADVKFHDSGDGTIARANFFAAVTPRSATSPGTLVKIKGLFSGGVFVGQDAELEND